MIKRLDWLSAGVRVLINVRWVSLVSPCQRHNRVGLRGSANCWQSCSHMHFRTIVAGMEVVIHTDHLNNTVLGQNLTSPDKILRMLLKIEGLVKPRWQFAPGNTQVGDGPSRNPEDRDAARGESEGKDHMPKTLTEAFKAVSP